MRWRIGLGFPDTIHQHANADAPNNRLITGGIARRAPNLEIGGFFLTIFLRAARCIFIARQIILNCGRPAFAPAGTFLHALLAARHLIVWIEAFLSDLDTIKIHIHRRFGAHAPRPQAAFQHFLDRARQA